MAAAFPGPNNVYLVSHEATNNLIVGYSRNADDFPIARYAQIIPVKKQVGAYLQLTAEEAGRIVSSDVSEYLWADGDEEPMGNDGTESHQYATYNAKRYSFGFNLGDLTTEQADWNVLAVHSAVKAQQAMTARTYKSIGYLTTGANWPAAQTATATTAGGGKWDVSTTALLYIKKSLKYAAMQIVQSTLAAVKPKDLILVVSPDLAGLMANSLEISDYLKASPFALAQVRGDVESQNGKYGLPDELYGYKVVIEDTVRVSTRKGATTTKGFVLANTNALLLARPGGIEGKYGSPSFATCQLFMKEEMTVESMRDPNNRRTRARVVENYDVAIGAPASGFLFTACSN